MVPLFLNVWNGLQSKSFAEVCMLKFPRTSVRLGRETLRHTSVLPEIENRRRLAGPKITHLVNPPVKSIAPATTDKDGVPLTISRAELLAI
jgi:hypothetical protein